MYDTTRVHRSAATGETTDTWVDIMILWWTMYSCKWAGPNSDPRCQVRESHARIDEYDMVWFLIDQECIWQQLRHSLHSREKSYLLCSVLNFQDGRIQELFVAHLSKIFTYGVLQIEGRSKSFELGKYGQQCAGTTLIVGILAQLDLEAINLE